MAPGSVRRGSPGWLLLLLLSAVAVGGAAALLSGPASPFTPAAPTPATPLSYAVVGQIIGFSVVGLCLLLIGHHIYQRFTSDTLQIPNRAIVMFLVAFLLAVGFIVLARSGVLGTSPLLETQPAGGGNGSSSSPPVTNLTNTTNQTLGTFHVGGWSLPGWVLYVGIVIAAIVAAVVVPRAITFLRERREPIPEAGRAAATRRDFSEALQALDDPSNPDVRAVIIGLYAKLLVRVRPSVARIESLAPREIESECVERLGIRGETAGELTRLFEEARYSSHALAPDLADRAHRAVNRALADLDRSPGSP